MTPTRALVIGGTRNLGPGIVAALLEKGSGVCVMNRGLTPDDLPPEVERVRADRSRETDVAAALAGRSFDLVVDTTLYSGPDAEAVVRVLDGRAGRYVWLSTGQVYLVRVGPARPFREEDYDGPLMSEPPAARAEDLRNWRYGIRKREAEDALRRAFRERGFPVVTLRLPMVNSERDHYGRIAAYAHRLRDAGPLLLPTDELPLRHVYGRDVVAAVVRAAGPDVPAGTVVNVCQDETLTLPDMLGLIAAAAGTGLDMVRAPRGRLEEAGLLPACSPFSDPWMSALDNARARSVLGLAWTPPADYVPRVVEAALRLPADRVPGYDRRPLELAFAAA